MKLLLSMLAPINGKETEQFKIISVIGAKTPKKGLH
jgi:hypothetical protein